MHALSELWKPQMHEKLMENIEQEKQRKNNIRTHAYTILVKGRDSTFIELMVMYYAGFESAQMLRKIVENITNQL